MREEEQPLDTLIADLRNPDCAVQWAAADALGQRQAREAVAPLVAVLGTTNDYFRKKIVAALDRIDSEWRQSEAVKLSVPGFLAVLADESKTPIPHGDVRELSALLSGDPRTQERTAAAFVLGEVREPRAVELLKTIVIRREAHQHLVKAAADALGKIGDDAAVDALIEALELPYGSECAARALGLAGGRRAFEYLVVAAYKGGGAPVRAAATQTLSRLDPAWRECALAKRLRPSFFNG
jgi:HEAT repeat protein